MPKDSLRVAPPAACSPASEPAADSPAAPFPESASVGAPDKVPHPTLPGRWSDGTAAPANQIARNEIGAIKQRASLQVDAKEEIKSRVLTDLGAEDDGPSETLSGLVSRYAEVVLLAGAYYDYLEQQGGPIGVRGRQRAAVTGYLAALDRQMKLATTIGLERKQRPCNPIDAIRRAVAEANR